MRSTLSGCSSMDISRKTRLMVFMSVSGDTPAREEREREKE
jgi:hypothetical protein